MDEAQAADILMTLRGELVEARRTAEIALQRASAIQKLIEGYIELFPALGRTEPSNGNRFANLEIPDAPKAQRPRGQEAVLLVLKAPEFRGRYWTVAQMVQELRARGWQPETRGGDDAAAVRTALTRVVDADPHVWKGKGEHGQVVWYYRHEGMSKPKFAGDDDTPAGLRDIFEAAYNAEVDTG